MTEQVDEKNYLIIALSKGRIFKETLPLLAHAGIVPADDPDTSRKLILDTNQDDVKLDTLRREISTVDEKMSLSGLLEFLLDRRQHIAIVRDEYGGTEGLVTLEDLVETLLGLEIVDEMDKVEDMQALARQQWHKRARAQGLEVEKSG